ncbi:MAG TPA: PPE domain-containing protein [Pseudonocardiaceae bacterium]|nr:PPE domain-containing protein [Pseudonocardiaceae bacterium]
MTSGFDTNWDAYTHQQMYDMIHNNVGHFVPKGATNGRGVHGGATAQDDWTSLQATMRQIQDAMLKALQRANASWTGEASDMMRSSVAPLAQWNQDVSAAGTTNSDAIAGHVDLYSTAQHTMPEPVQVTSTANSAFLGVPAGFTHLLGMQTDQDAQEAEAQQRKQHAVEIMTNYSVGSENAVDSMRDISAPATVTVAVTPTQPGAVPSAPIVGPHATTPRVRDTATTTRPGVGSPGRISPSGTPAATPPIGTTPVATAPVGTTPTSTTSSAPSSTPTGGPPAGTTTSPPADDPIAVPITGPPAGGVGDEPPLGSRRVGSGFGATPNEPGRPPAGRAGAGGGGGVGAGEPPAAEATALGRAGAGRPSDEDDEHGIPDYLRGPHDEFWEGTEKYIVRTIGEDD